MITFISTHLDHTSVETDRPAQAKKINEAFANEPLAILAGDMNAKPGTEPLKILGEQWTDTTGPDAAPTVPVTNPKAKIDYVLYKPASRFRVVETRVLDEAVASDHRAFLAVVEVQNGK
jgi:endonuclease/exonuclease/phosphatase family metal-dependent hydrolase